MRIFWAIIGVLVVVTVGVMAWSRSGGSRGAGGSGGVSTPPSTVVSPPPPPARTSEGSPPAAPAVPPPAPPAPIASPEEPDAAPEPAVAGKEEPASAASKSKESTAESTVSPAPVAPSVEKPAVMPGTAPAEAAAAPEKPADAAPQLVVPDQETIALPTLNELLGIPDLVTSSRRQERPSAADSQLQSAPAPAAAPSSNPAAAAAATLVPQDDGSTLVDNRFTMRGTGEKSSPYEVTWDMLLSAQETYQPRLGKKVIPDRLKMLDGKWVKLTGYVAFPLMASSADEMLVMLNQWDGCCIGVPPTPYDAVEVRLAKAAEGEDRLMTSGVVVGRFKVDPFLVRDWLVSLYMMEDAEATAD